MFTRANDNAIVIKLRTSGGAFESTGDPCEWRLRAHVLHPDPYLIAVLSQQQAQSEPQAKKERKRLILILAGKKQRGTTRNKTVNTMHNKQPHSKRKCTQVTLSLPQAG